MKRHYSIPVLFCILFVQNILTAQSITNVLVDASASNGECTIVINPKNPNYIIAATNPCILYRSTDAGLTWSETNFTFSSAPISWDVVVAADTAGHFYFQAMDQGELFRTFRSDDFGLTWGTETVFGEPGCTEDKSWMSTDHSPLSPYNGKLYSTWTLRHGSGCDTAGFFFVQHSDDFGQTWSARDTLGSDPGFVPPIGGGMASGPAGEAYVTWCGELPNRIHFKKSLDGGTTWSSTATIVDNNVQPSTDYAAFIDHTIGAISPFTSLACDVSGGAHNGNIYCTWADLRNGTNNGDIFLARSTDGGQTWNTQRINEDTTTRNQILPTVAVDPTSGWIYIAYVDARLNTDNFDDTLNYYLAWSSDGGQTFQNILVSQQATMLTYLHSDYMGCDAYGGNIHLLWVGGTSTQQTWTAHLTQTQLTSIAPPATSNNILLYPAFPNPAIDFTTVDFQLYKTSTVSLGITDLNGRVLAQPINKKQFEPGRHEFRIHHQDYHLAAGTYIITLSTPGGKASRRFEVVK